MGLPAMSLINQMLQDLDKRGETDALPPRVQQHVRPVPINKGLHPAWWVAGLLSLVVIGLLLWMWLRPPQVVIPPELALKIASEITSPQPALQPSAAHDANETKSQGSGNSSEVAAEPTAQIATTSHNDKLAVNTGDAPAISPPAPVNLTLAVKVPLGGASDATVKQNPASAAASQSSVAAAADLIAPVGSLQKQIKEFTPSQHAENEYRKATLSLQQGRSGEAISMLEQALALDPQHAAARQTLVGVLLDQKRTDDAMRVAQTGLTGDPSQIGLAMILARVQIERGELKPATETLQRSLPYAQDRADYHAFLGAVLQRDKRHGDAIEQYQQALRRSPQSGIWWMGLGISLQALGKNDEANDAYTHARDTGTLKPELQAFVEQKLAQLQH